MPSLRFLADSSKVSKSGPSQSRARSLDRLICNGLFYVSSKSNFGGKDIFKSAGGKGDAWFNQSDGALHMKKNFGKTEDE